MENKKRNYYLITMLVSGIFFLLLHLTFVGFTNDDSFFVTVRSKWDSLWELLIYRYETDTSRLLSEAFLFTFIKCPFIVWQLADTLICLLITHSLSVILVGDKWDKRNLAIFMIFAAYPYMHMGSAGWICTSLNYIWPLAGFLYGLSGVVRRERGEKLTPISYVLYIAALIFAANCEMSATVVLLFFAVPVLYAIIEKRSFWYEITGAVIGLSGLVFALTAPGNGERTAMEAENWMPEFFDLTILDKARLCSVFVFEHFVAIPDVIFFLFAALLLFVGIKQSKMWLKVVACIPLAVDIIFTGIYFVNDFIIGHKTNYDFTTPSIFVTSCKIALVQYSELIGLVLFILCSVITIWNVLENSDGTEGKQLLNKKQAVWAIWGLGVGFAVRMALMLSPTMFASWHRTLIFMYFAFMMVSFVLIEKLSKKWTKVFINVILVLGIIVNLILTVGLQIRKMGM